MHGVREPVRAAALSGDRRWVLGLLCTAQFMLILDVTVVNVALPDIGLGLHLGREALTWVVTAYSLCFGGLMLLGGRLADVLGARRTALAGLALFTAASLVSGLAGSGGALLTGRVVQGIGAALLSPAALACVTGLFTGPERGRALGVWAAVGGAGSAAGVLLGGLLAAGPGWRWIFYVNVPVGLAVLAVLPMFLPAEPARRRGRVDVLGAVLITAATGALIYGLIKAGSGGWGSAGPVGVAALLYGAFVLVESRVAEPLVDLATLRRRPVATGAVLFLVATALLIGVFFIGSFFLQRVHGDSAVTTGLLFLPVAVGAGVGAHLGGRARAVRHTVVGGLLLAAGGTGLVAVLLPTVTAGWALIPGATLTAAGCGAVFVAAMTTALGFVEPERGGVVSGLVNTFHEIGGAVGVAVLSTVAATGLRDGTTAGFRAAFAVAGGIALVGALFALVAVPPGEPAHTGGPARMH